ncbi:hypothetical protein ASG89_05250 [Paenibacillus sp. Soil766]|uniref:hypothetical protein n=1 Tax=Paenibacillus sp. Soil766 TaxID=1736404 RepID=UPI0007095603|nr:hypothetical protein [Paenibacillus sp. Soil766]KRE98416.1 hypothetical protein ASG89_05250 [Paenibacillus sp. Soil766]
MNLIHYYREQFIELKSQFEPNWEEDPLYKFGYRWNAITKNMYKEFFLITQMQDEPLCLMYVIELPEKYKKTNISEVVKNVSSSYELSMYYNSEKILLASCISIENLQQTSLGFLNQARGEIIDLVFSAIQLKDM